MAGATTGTKGNPASKRMQNKNLQARREASWKQGGQVMQKANIVHDTATVTVTEPVDGTKKRRKPSSRRSATPVIEIKVLQEVLDTAKKILRDGETIKIISATEVWTVPK